MARFSPLLVMLCNAISEAMISFFGRFYLVIIPVHRGRAYVFKDAGDYASEWPERSAPIVEPD